MKKFLIILLTICLAAVLLPTKAFAEETQDMWDGTIATSFADGDGTETSPYEIATSAQFAYFAQQIAAGNDTTANYIVTANLDLKEQNWAPIAGSFDDYESEKYFAGNFNGQGYTITYKIEQTEKVGPFEMCGLFGIAEGSISNLNIKGDIVIKSDVEASYVGGLCGLFEGDIMNCDSDVNITLTSNVNTNAAFFGGITGEFQDGTMKNCQYTGSISSEQATSSGDLYFGGISGTLYAGTISECTNKGMLNIKNVTTGATGGIAGMVYTGGDPVEPCVKNCYNVGNVTSNFHSGGIAGTVSCVLFKDYPTETASCKVLNCFSTGEVTTTGNGKTGQVAALVYATNNAGEGADVSATVENCYYITGTDANATLVNNLDELYEKMTQNSEAGTWLRDADGNVKLYWEFTQELTPSGIFNAASADGGILTNVASGMKYSIDGGNKWSDITDSTVEVKNVSTKDGIQIYQPGDNVSTIDSEIQTIAVTQAEQPANLVGIGCTTSQQNDGKITGVNDKMEYKLSDDTVWTIVSSDTITGLINGSYDIRVKANGTELASSTVTIKVDAHTCTATGDWHSDESGHWNTCQCGEILGKADHTFKWVIDKNATEIEKGSKHEECSVCGFKKAAVEIPSSGAPAKPDKPSKPNKPSGTSPSVNTSDTTSPKTGDSSSIVLWIAILLASGAVLTVTVLYIRKKKYSR